jgi:hypothetical protein
VACGRKGDPVAPELRTPGPPKDIRLSGADGKLTVSWSAPAEDLAGRRIETALGYIVLREALPPGSEPCESCPEDLKPVARLDPAERRARGLPETAWTDPGVEPGWTYRYRVRAVDAKGRLGPVSGVAKIAWVAMPKPTAEAVPGDGQALVRVLDLHWPPSLEPIGIRVYGADGSLLAESKPDADAVHVMNLRNSIEHRLSVRLATRTPEGWVVESPSTPVTVTPADTTPPLPPADLVAAWTPGGVRLRWLPSGKEPYAEVLILRTEDQGEPVEVARLPGHATTFLDTSTAPGRAYTYTVLVTDRAGNRSLPTRSVRIRSR